MSLGMTHHLLSAVRGGSVVEAEETGNAGLKIASNTKLG